MHTVRELPPWHFLTEKGEDRLKISIKISSFIFLLFIFLPVKHVLPMDSLDSTFYPFENIESAKKVIFVHLSFHELNHYSQTNQQNNKSVVEYFNKNRDIIGYFKDLHQLMATAPELDRGKVWALAKIAAAFDLQVQRWILSYAINYMTVHFLTPLGEKINPCFHQWVYVIRSFQGCDLNFEADSFIDNALDKYILCCDLGKTEKLKNNFDGNPKASLQHQQKIKLHFLNTARKKFTENKGYFYFLFLYDRTQEIYRECYEKFNSKLLVDIKLLKFCIDLLLMRRAKEPLNKIIQGLVKGELGGFCQLQRTKIFLAVYNEWKFKTPLDFEDKDMKNGLEALNKRIPGRQERNRRISQP